MRSRLTTITRLSAHVSAVVLLTVVLIYSKPSERDAPPVETATAQPDTAGVPVEPAPSAPAVNVPPVSESVPTEQGLPQDAPAASPAPRPETPPEPALPADASSGSEAGAGIINPEPVPAPPSVPAVVPPGEEGRDSRSPAAPPEIPPEPALPADVSSDPEAGAGMVDPEPVPAPPSVPAVVPPGETGRDNRSPAAPPETPPEPALPADVSSDPEAGAGMVDPEPVPAPPSVPAVVSPDEAGRNGSPPEPAAPAGDAKPADSENAAAETLSLDGTASTSADGATSESVPIDAAPDDSGTPGIGGSADGPPEPAAESLPDDAGPETLGDGVYWIGPDRPLAETIARLPEETRLVFLIPDEGAELPRDAGPAAETIVAAGDGLDADAAERFLRLVSREDGEDAAAAVLPGAWGAAFFKGAYLMVLRGLDPDAAVAELASDLESAGERRDEIAHRLRRLDIDPLRALLKP